MYAVFKSGGKQYRVEPGQTVRLEKLPLEEGQEIDFDQVLLTEKDGEVNFGKPFLEGAKVKAVATQNGRGKKVNIIKFKRRKHHMKRMGHRQDFTEVKITDIIV